jgi:hypothetical protein
VAVSHPTQPKPSPPPTMPPLHASRTHPCLTLWRPHPCPQAALNNPVVVLAAPGKVPLVTPQFAPLQSPLAAGTRIQSLNAQDGTPGGPVVLRLFNGQRTVRKGGGLERRLAPLK